MHLTVVKKPEQTTNPKGHYISPTYRFNRARLATKPVQEVGCVNSVAKQMGFATPGRATKPVQEVGCIKSVVKQIGFATPRQATNPVQEVGYVKSAVPAMVLGPIGRRPTANPPASRGGGRP